MLSLSPWKSCANQLLFSTVQCKLISIHFWNWNITLFTTSFLKIQQVHNLEDIGYWPVHRIKAVKYLHYLKKAKIYVLSKNTQYKSSYVVSCYLSLMKLWQSKLYWTYYFKYIRTKEKELFLQNSKINIKVTLREMKVSCWLSAKLQAVIIVMASAVEQRLLNKPLSFPLLKLR